MDMHLRLGRAYLEAEGLASTFVETIHPEDEMHSTLEATVGAGKSARVEYWKSGREVILALENILSHCGKGWGDLNHVLEFACGYGRVTRHLIQVVDPKVVEGSEILGDAVKFVRETFGVRAFESSTDPDQLELPPHFDLIFASSLFSHLPRHRFEQWLTKLSHALAPGGILVFSTHGSTVRSEVPKDSTGFTFIRQSESANLSTDEYGSTFVTPEVVEEIARDCQVARIAGVERELWSLQDLYVASRDPALRLDDWRNMSFVRGSIDRFDTSPEGQFRISGWAADAAAGEKVCEVTLLVDGSREVPAILGQERQDVANAHSRSEWSHSGWYLEGILPPEIAAGDYVIAAFGHSSSGRRMCFDVRAIEVPLA